MAKADALNDLRSDRLDTKRRIIDRLKRVDATTAASLAHEFELTDTAIRQHLDALEHSGLVERRQGVPDGRGRPPVLWALTPVAIGLFPDRHADLTVDLVNSIRQALGDDALATVIAARSARQADLYRRLLPDAPVGVRVRTLAEQRTAEGYMADVERDGDDYLLVEHHCPIHDAATECIGLCAAELDAFRTALGDDVEVTREQHLLAGDHRCTYRISRRG